MFLQLIIGPMFSGKTTELLKLIRRYQVVKEDKILVINHTMNYRYGTEKVVSHDMNRHEHTVALSRLEQVYDTVNLKLFDVVFIEELQFFPDAYDEVIKLVEKWGKHVIAAGLDGDFQRFPFGDVLKLIPVSDEVVRLTAICKKCGDGTAAPFTRRTCEETEQAMVGAGEHYEAVCRRHYLRPW
jgi:thymidine kinase